MSTDVVEDHDDGIDDDGIDDDGYGGDDRRSAPDVTEEDKVTEADKMSEGDKVTDADKVNETDEDEFTEPAWLDDAEENGVEAETEADVEVEQRRPGTQASSGAQPPEEDDQGRRRCR